MVGPGRRIVTGPTPQPLPFGLLSASVVVDDDQILQAGVTWETLTCGVAHLTEAECFTSESIDPLVEDDGVPYTTDSVFNVYALHRCRLPGGGWADADRVVRAKLAAGEDTAIEEGFADRVLLDTDAQPDLTPTPGTALLPIEAVALLEEYAGNMYSGVPTIHAARSTGTILTNRAGVGASAANGRLQTGLGSIVAAGTGYTAASRAVLGGVTPGADERWLWVTGVTSVRRGLVGVLDPVRMTDPDTNAPMNEFGILAARTVSVAADCIVARILVQSPTAAVLG